MSELNSQNENELQRLKGQYKAVPLNQSQKIEISEKIDKLIRGNMENNEIREKLTKAFSVNEQQLSMLKSHILSIIEDNLGMIYKLEVNNLEMF